MMSYIVPKAQVWFKLGHPFTIVMLNFSFFFGGHCPGKFLHLLFWFHRIMFLLLKSDTQTMDQTKHIKKNSNVYWKWCMFSFFTNPPSKALFVACEYAWPNDSMCTIYVPEWLKRIFIAQNLWPIQHLPFVSLGLGTASSRAFENALSSLSLFDKF